MHVKTGAGKTIIGLYLLQKLKLKTLIVTPNKTLFAQWIERINSYFNLKYIAKKSQSIQWVTEDICIGIINSLSMTDKQFNKDNEDSFDLVIVDECHKLGANGFLQLLDIFSKSRYMLALSATPDR